MRAICVAASFVAISHAGYCLDLTVKTKSGRVKGTGVEIISFKSIPYAAAPVGHLRWSPPEDPVPWSNVKDASQFGAQCPQPQRVIPGLAGARPLPTSEDCLTLNIWT